MERAATIWWSGPICGLGNRLIAMAAVIACAGQRHVYFPWSNDPSCPGEYADIFEPMASLTTAIAPPPGSIEIETGWEPFDIYEQFRQALNLEMSPAQFSEAFVRSLRGLSFRSSLLEAAREWRSVQGAAPLLGVHIRRTDRTAQHRQQFRDFLSGKAGLNRELPIYLSALYGLAPNRFMDRFENAVLSGAMRRFVRAQPAIAYCVFTDNREQADGFQKAAAFYGAAPSKSRREGPATGEREQTGLRRTNINGAMLDLLCLSNCDAIAQNNRASTFSLVASIIGSKPIITAKTTYPFWLKIGRALGHQPNETRRTP